MPRYILDIAYNGSEFSGWQRQADAITVQQTIEDALRKLHHPDLTIYGSGRTDAGVHALHQIAHFDVSALFESPDALCVRLNRMLPKSIHIWSIKEVSVDFHARFDASARHYEYVLFKTYVPRLMSAGWLIDEPLDITKMKTCLEMIVGNHDFTSFCRKNKELDHYRCIVQEIDLKEETEEIRITIKANRFLHHMVRSIVGDVVQVGLGKMSADFFRELLEKADRIDIGTKAPAHGLTLMKVDYP